MVHHITSRRIVLEYQRAHFCVLKRCWLSCFFWFGKLNKKRLNLPKESFGTYQLCYLWPAISQDLAKNVTCATSLVWNGWRLDWGLLLHAKQRSTLLNNVLLYFFQINEFTSWKILLFSMFKTAFCVPCLFLSQEVLTRRQRCSRDPFFISFGDLLTHFHLDLLT